MKYVPPVLYQPNLSGVGSLELEIFLKFQLGGGDIG
jgi:hypothetical protein